MNEIGPTRPGDHQAIRVRERSGGRVRPAPFVIEQDMTGAGIAMFKKILIANRGESRLRIQRACREMGIKTVAVLRGRPRREARAPGRRTVCIGPAPSRRAISTCRRSSLTAEVTDAEAIHPGYGFLSENADFAERVERSGFTFIGPPPESIRADGRQVSAKAAMRRPAALVPGSDGAPARRSEGDHPIARTIGYPVIIKAAGGGGGRGMRVVQTEAALIKLRCDRARARRAAFGNGTVYMERTSRRRAIEIQVLADGTTATPSTWASATARCSAATRRSYWSPAPGILRACRRIGDRCAEAMLQDRLPRRRHLRVPVRGRRVLFHRDEHRVQVGASGDRDGHRHRHRAGADPRRRRQKTPFRSARQWYPRPRHRMPHQRRGSGTPFVPSPGASPAGTPRRARHARRFARLQPELLVPPNYDSMMARLIGTATRAPGLARMRTALSETRGRRASGPTSRCTARRDGQSSSRAAPTSTIPKAGWPTSVGSR